MAADACAQLAGTPAHISRSAGRRGRLSDALDANGPAQGTAASPDAGVRPLDVPGPTSADLPRCFAGLSAGFPDVETTRSDVAGLQGRPR
ncbi:hypothetical protein OG410_02645 [Streptomyces sp. NBC_00659]|uniref:hypothetical protein n=1 Tax=Streptomyces sp. NBC_00659 TaxID=2903669 RepID=UPI002E37CA9F|nr:hypothetical protein [Streptomyces sp. NBC_00659]